jgi:hypothetical protein
MKDTNTISKESAASVSASESINKNYKAYVIYALVLAFLITSFLTLKAFTNPLAAEEKSIDNTIEVKTSFDYSGVVKRSTLYPAGGKVSGDDIIFTSLTDKLIINVKTNVSTEKPVTVEGTSELIYTLAAKDMWHKDYEVVASHPVQSEGLSHTLLQEDITIGIKQLFDYISRVEEETSVNFGDYLLIVKPKITGAVYQDNGDKVYDIHTELEIPFEISNQYIKYAAESPEKEFMETRAIESINNHPERMKLLGTSIPVITARYVFGLLSLLSIACLIVKLLSKAKLMKQNLSEIDRIDKKYKYKIVEVSSKVVAHNQMQVDLKSFSALMQIAEDKDEPILKYENKLSGTAYYFVVGTAATYCYEVLEKNKNEGCETINVL